MKRARSWISTTSQWSTWLSPTPSRKVSLPRFRKDHPSSACPLRSNPPHRHKWPTRSTALPPSFLPSVCPINSTNRLTRTSRRKQPPQLARSLIPPPAPLSILNSQVRQFGHSMSQRRSPLPSRMPPDLLLHPPLRIRHRT